jgi:uncharacterized protein
VTDEFNVENMEPAKDMDVSDDDRLWALLAYVLSPLIPILILLIEDKKNRPFLKAHNVQALIWGVLTWIVWGASSPLLCIPGILMLAVSIYWGWQAYQGKMVKIPILSDFVRNQGWA